MAINLNQNNPNNPEGMQTGPQAAGGPQPKQQGTGFTNLKSVLNANKNNKLGQAIGTGVQNISNKTQGQTQQAQNQFAQQIGQSVQDIQKGTKVQQNLSDLDFSKDSEKASQNIQEVGGEEYANAAANLRKGYTGPQGLQNQDTLQAQSQQLGQTAQGLMTSGGRQAALQRFINVGPGYTQGKQQLDNMLLGQGDTPQQIAQARKQATQTAQATNQAIEQAAVQGRTTGQRFDTLGQDLTGKIQGLGQNLGSALDTRTQSKVQEAQTEIQGLKDALTAGQLTNDQYNYMINNVLGGSANTYNLTNDQLSGLFNANTDYTRSNVANQNEVNARDALARLSGASSGDELVNLDESKVGTAGPAFIKNDLGLSAYNTQAKAAADAQAAFNFATHSIGGGGFNQTTSLNPNLSYQQVSDFVPHFTSGNYRPTNPIYSGTAEAAQYEKDRDRWMQATADSLARTGAAPDSSAILQELHRGATTQTNLSEAMDKYNQVNKQYGIGNNLARLLKR